MSRVYPQVYPEEDNRTNKEGSFAISSSPVSVLLQPCACLGLLFPPQAQLPAHPTPCSASWDPGPGAPGAKDPDSIAGDRGRKRSQSQIPQDLKARPRSELVLCCSARSCPGPTPALCLLPAKDPGASGFRLSSLRAAPRGWELVLPTISPQP